MPQDHNGDDSSHYEVSLTAGQAFIAFVLLLLSLAAAFAFGVIVGKGQFDESLVASAGSEPVGSQPVAQEARVDGVGEFAPPRRESAGPAPVIVEMKTAAAGSSNPRSARADSHEPNEPGTPHFAQLLSTADSRAAEALAAKLIDAGFTTAYVERGSSSRGIVHRVRVNFPSEADARMSLENLKSFASGDIWIAPAPPAAR